MEGKIFEAAYEVFKKRKVDTIAAAYELMCLRHYSTPVIGKDGSIEDVKLYDKKLIPSEQKFRRYVEKKLYPLSISAFKKGPGKRRSDDRIRYGNAQSGANFPGEIIEVDACEIDLIIVSEKHLHHGIGRPVVYFAVDVYSICIVGYYVGFENNSFLGASSLFANMFFGNSPHYREDGLNITPGGIIPHNIRTDQGSEWVSKGIRRIGREVGFNTMIVQPGTGSLKGLVENSFHVYQSKIGAVGTSFGAIYQAYESKHYETASLILSDVKKTIEAFILYFNQMDHKKYDMSKDMIKNKIKPIGCELWEYGVTHGGNPKYTTKERIPELVYNLCVPCTGSMKAKISLEGIIIKDLKYICTDRRFTDLLEEDHYHRREVKYEVRFDPRLVDYIWVKIDDEILQVPLAEKRKNQLTYKGLTWLQYNLYYVDKIDMIKENETEQLRNKLRCTAETYRIMEESKEKREQIEEKNVKKNIREFRKLEQEDERRKSSLVNVSGISQDIEIPELELIDTGLYLDCKSIEEAETEDFEIKSLNEWVDWEDM